MFVSVLPILILSLDNSLLMVLDSDRITKNSISILYKHMFDFYQYKKNTRVLIKIMDFAKNLLGKYGWKDGRYNILFHTSVLY